MLHIKQIFEVLLLLAFTLFSRFFYFLFAGAKLLSGYISTKCDSSRAEIDARMIFSIRIICNENVIDAHRFSYMFNQRVNFIFACQVVTYRNRLVMLDATEICTYYLRHRSFFFLLLHRLSVYLHYDVLFVGSAFTRPDAMVRLRLVRTSPVLRLRQFVLINYRFTERGTC